MVGFIRSLFFSENRDTYRSIAREYGVTARRVYDLAHGKRARSNKDYRVLKKLRELDIIEGIQHNE